MPIFTNILQEGDKPLVSMRMDQTLINVKAQNPVENRPLTDDASRTQFAQLQVPTQLNPGAMPAWASLNFEPKQARMAKLIAHRNVILPFDTTNVILAPNGPLVNNLNTYTTFKP
jgi:hypothetical protein